MDKRINALMTEYICSGCLIMNCASMIKGRIAGDY